MEAVAVLKNLRISAQKVRLVVDQIRGLNADRALDVLQFSRKNTSGFVKKLLESAIANAEHNEGADIDELKVVRAYVDEAKTMRRFRCRARGRGAKILKRGCHVTIVVGNTNKEVN